MLGYLPILKPYDNSQKKSNDFKVAVRETFHKCLKVLLEPIQVLSNGLDLNLNGETFWFFPRISVVISVCHKLLHSALRTNHLCQLIPVIFVW